MSFLDGTGLNRLWARIQTLVSRKQDKISLPGDAAKYYNGEGQFTTPPNTTYGVVSTQNNGLAPKLSGNAGQYLDGTGKFSTPPDSDTTYSKATRTDDGLVPAPGGSGTTRYLREDLTWGTPPDTTYSAATRTNTGLVPAPGGSTQTRYLREDLTWVVPPDNNTTYNPVTTGANGLMIATDKAKLDYTNIAYGTCATAAGTAAKDVTVVGNTNWALNAGAIVVVKFSNDVPANATLNINSKGGKALWCFGKAITAGIIKAGDLATVVYDGTQYQLVAIDRTVYTVSSAEFINYVTGN